MKTNVFNALIHRVSQEAYHTKPIDVSLVEKDSLFYPLEDDKGVRISNPVPTVISFVWCNSKLYALDHDSKQWVGVVASQLRDELSGFKSFKVMGG